MIPIFRISLDPLIGLKRGDLMHNDQNILYICHSYNSFQKDPIEESSKYLNNVNVLVRTNPIAEIANYFPVHRLDRYKQKSKIDLNSLPENISVFPTPIIYAPLDSQYKKLGELHYRAVEKLIQKNHMKFDLIHSHFTWSAGYAGARLKEKYNVPFVVTAHGYDIYSLPFKDDEWKNKIEYVLNTADHIITVSRINLAFIKMLNISTPVTVIPNGFRNDLFYPQNSRDCRKELNLPQDKKIILTVGNLESVKNHTDLVEAAHRIILERKDIICVIVGYGKLYSALKHQIHSLGLDDYIILTGGKPHNKIPLWMNACDQFVLPSLNEGNPTVMFEALGCGKPFIGTSVGGVPEVISSEQYGLLVEPANTKDLADKILIALDHDWDRELILEYAEQFRWENITKNIIKVYQNLDILHDKQYDTQANNSEIKRLQNQ